MQRPRAVVSNSVEYLFTLRRAVPTCFVFGRGQGDRRPSSILLLLQNVLRPKTVAAVQGECVVEDVKDFQRCSPRSESLRLLFRVLALLCRSVQPSPGRSSAL
jgi:hypothetical protein